jgi:hypothetical protein
MKLVFKIVSLLILSQVLIHCSQPMASESAMGQKSITWSEHIAPIIYQHCSSCHRPGESGPFNLLSYKDAVRKSALIKFTTSTRYMPPWPADPLYSHFVDERVLSIEEIDLIKNWVNGGMQRGDSLNEPPVPQFVEGSFFGKPDLVIKPQQPIAVKGNGNDVFLIVKYPYTLDKDTIVDFVEFVPDLRKRVHHVNGHLLSYDAGRKFNYHSGLMVEGDNKAELLQVYERMHLPYKDNLLPRFPVLTPNTVYYLPGYIPPAWPEEIGGYRMKKHGAFLLNNVHYGPGQRDTVDNSYINVFFRKSPIKRPVTETQMGTFGISAITPDFIIPANEVKTFHTQTTLSKAISIISVNPHMHLIGKSFIAFSVSKDGDTIPLIRINKWDFRWQYYYTFIHPIKIAAGSTIHVYGTFDNTANNPSNPFRPPRTITQGNGIESMKTTEEMFQFIFTYMSYKEGDEKINLQREKIGGDSE